jgi:hypothetical protein
MIMGKRRLIPTTNQAQLCIQLEMYRARKHWQDLKKKIVEDEGRGQPLTFG